MKQIVLILTFVLISISYAKKFIIKKGDIIDGVLNVGIVLPKKPQQNFKIPYQELKEKEPPQVYPVSITLTSPDFQNCNAIGELIYNPQFDRFYGNVSKISCNENGKVKDYKTKGYILDKSSNIGIGVNNMNLNNAKLIIINANTEIKIMIIKEVK